MVAARYDERTKTRMEKTQKLQGERNVRVRVCWTFVVSFLYLFFGQRYTFPVLILAAVVVCVCSSSIELSARVCVSTAAFLFYFDTFIPFANSYTH